MLYIIHQWLHIILITEPLSPFDLQATDVLPTTATITWSTPPPNRLTPWAIVFNYEIVLTEHGFGLPVITTNSSVESVTFAGLEEFDNYSLVVAAENKIGRGDFSITFNFSTPQAGKRN